MKKMMIIGMALLTMFLMTEGARAEEAGCFQTQDNWILRTYSNGTGPYTISLAVLDTAGAFVPANSIQAFSTPGNLCTNPCVFEGNAANADLSLACDAGGATAYILHDHAGQLQLTTIENIASVQVGAPVLHLSATAINFGAVTVGTFKTGTVTVSNTGNANLHITSVSAPAAPFSKTGDTCSGGTIAPAGTCAITIKFAPTAAVASAGSFSISSDGGNATVQLNGTGGTVVIRR